MTCWKASSNISSKYISGTKSLCEMSWLLTWWLGDFDGFCLWNSPWFPTGRERFTSSDHILRIFAVSTIVPFRLFPKFNRSNLFDVAVSGFTTQYICQVIVPLFDLGFPLCEKPNYDACRIWCWDPYAVLHPDDLAGFQWGSNKPIQWTHESIFSPMIDVDDSHPYPRSFCPVTERVIHPKSAAPELPKTKKNPNFGGFDCIYIYIIYHI